MALKRINKVCCSACAVPSHTARAWAGARPRCPRVFVSLTRSVCFSPRRSSKILDETHPRIARPAPSGKTSSIGRRPSWARYVGCGSPPNPPLFLTSLLDCSPTRPTVVASFSYPSTSPPITPSNRRRSHSPRASTIRTSTRMAAFASISCVTSGAPR